MDYGAKSVRNLNEPRMHEFTPEVIASLICSDCMGLKGVPPERVFGGGKVRYESFKRLVCLGYLLCNLVHITSTLRC